MSGFTIIDEFLWELIMAMKLQDCYKVIVSCIYDFENWTGEDAKIFDKCTQSSKEDVTIWDWQELESIRYYWGDKDSRTSRSDLSDTDAKCTPGKLSWIPIWKGSL